MCISQFIILSASGMVLRTQSVCWCWQPQEQTDHCKSVRAPASSLSSPIPEGRGIPDESLVVRKISAQIGLLNYLYPQNRQRRVSSFLYLNKGRVCWGHCPYRVSQSIGVVAPFLSSSPNHAVPPLFLIGWNTQKLDGQQVGHEPALCTGGQEHQWHPRVKKKIKKKLIALRKAWQAGQGRWSFPSTLPWWGLTWSTVSSSGLLSTKKTEISWKESSGGPQRWWRAWRTSLKRKGWATYQGRWVHCICAVYRALMKTILNPFLVYTYTDAFIKSD